MTITVSGLEADAAPNRFTVSANIDCDGASRRLAFISEGNHPYLEKAEPSMDPFALSMLIPAMERGEDLVIEGPVDEILLESLRSSVQMLAGQVNRGWKPVKILAESRQESRLPEMQLGAATGMSCGIDSLTTYQLYRDLPGTPEQHRIKLFLHNNVGSHIGKGAFVRQLENVMRFGDGAGIPVVSVAADFSPFLQVTVYQESYSAERCGSARQWPPVPDLSPFGRPIIFKSGIQQPFLWHRCGRERLAACLVDAASHIQGGRSPSVALPENGAAFDFGSCPPAPYGLHSRPSRRARCIELRPLLQMRGIPGSS